MHIRIYMYAYIPEVVALCLRSREEEIYLGPEIAWSYAFGLVCVCVCMCIHIYMHMHMHACMHVTGNQQQHLQSREEETYLGREIAWSYAFGLE